MPSTKKTKLSSKQKLVTQSPLPVIDLTERLDTLQKELEQIQKQQVEIDLTTSEIKIKTRKKKVKEIKEIIQTPRQTQPQTKPQIQQQRRLLETIKEQIYSLPDWAFQLYAFYSFIETMNTEIPFLLYESRLDNFVNFLKMSFALYKVAQPLLSYYLKLLNLLNNSQKQRIITDEKLTTLTRLTELPIFEGLTITMQTPLQNLREYFNLLYTRNVFKTLTYFGEYFIIIPNIVIDVREQSSRLVGDVSYLPFLYDELPTIITTMMTHFFDAITNPLSSLTMGGTPRKKKTHYYKRRVTRKINNKPFIQTKEMMLSSYIINNNKPIIRGYSIQKKFIPNKKQVVVRANIITNDNKPKIKKKLKK